MSKPTPVEVDPMEALAQEIEGEAHQAQAELEAADPAAQEEAAKHEQAMAALEAGMQKFTMGMFKVGRAVLSRRLPELREEWSDPVLQGPSDALVPVLKRYLGGVMNRLGDKPELAVFAFSMIPLAMGYMDAMDRHDKEQEKLTVRTADYLPDPVPHGE